MITLKMCENIGTILLLIFFFIIICIISCETWHKSFESSFCLLQGLLENRLTFFIKIHSAILFNCAILFFLNNRTTQLYKFGKVSFQFRFYIGIVLVVISNYLSFQRKKKITQRKSVILYLQHTFFLFPKMLICPSDIFSSTSVCCWDKFSL